MQLLVIFQAYIIQINIFNKMEQPSQIAYFTKYLCPANPIISKKIQEYEPKLSLTTLPQINSQIIKNARPFFQLQQQSSSDQEITGKITLKNYYSNRTLVYKKFDNSEFSKRGNKQYYASIFTNLSAFPENEPYFSNKSELKFFSDRESMNLLAVHQVGQRQYDLILMNDMNSSGYTQWYHFGVFNKDKNVTVKFNIVNLYKTRSLYENGMKPLLSINKKNGGKEWQRGGTNIKYYVNDIKHEYGKKFYKTLSFQHTFLSENTETTFAHCFPYTVHDLKQKIKIWEINPRVKLRNIGLTALKINIPLLQISKQQNLENKRAVIIMARQHPGETVGSIICEEIINGLLKATQQNQFLLWRFTFYFIPIVNIDGVTVGNYRSNAFGYDLNRCWDRENPVKLPEIYAIKKQIKKIQKKMPIQLFLDLHGHSRKMGSFFYGNPFGKNSGILPYIASKQNPFVSFESSTFHKETSSKLTTARIVLGSMFKETGSFYTYETSFYGGILNGKKTHFTIQSLKDLGLNLLTSIFKVFIELHKEEKTLKESIFLKEIRKEIKSFRHTQEDEPSCSDSDAAEATLKQLRAMEKSIGNQNIKSFERLETDTRRGKKEQVSIQVQVDAQLSKQKRLRNLLDNKLLKKVHSRQNREFSELQRETDNYSLHVGFKRNSEEQERDQLAGSSPVARKKFLLQKLRIFGQTFIQPNPRDKNKETQTQVYGMQPLQNKKKPEPEPKINQYRKKNRNKSLILKLENKQKLGMGDIVKVNRLEYRKIRRDSKLDLISVLKKDGKTTNLPLLN